MTPEARKWLDDLDDLLAKGNTDTTRDIHGGADRAAWTGQRQQSDEGNGNDPDP